MKSKCTRRRFLTRSALATAGMNLAASAQEGQRPTASPAAPGPSVVASGSQGKLPLGKIGKLTLSRLISGGNLISGWAHSRDLHYVPSLMRHYNTEQKVLDTLQLLEEHGVNALIADPAKNVKQVLARYWKERGGKMLWIAEGHPEADDWKTDLQASIDFGAAAIYVQGVRSDRFFRDGTLEVLGACVSHIKSQGLPAGIGAHQLEVIVAAEKNNYGADFYVKTLHSANYWSARRPEQNALVIDNPADNYWDMHPEKTIAFMQEVRKPWIAFKVLAAGALKPEFGFRFAFENGADFICVGMFDFQVAQNVALVRSLLPQMENRERSWEA
jgi:hypothetical protein